MSISPVSRVLPVVPPWQRRSMSSLRRGVGASVAPASPCPPADCPSLAPRPTHEPSSLRCRQLARHRGSPSAAGSVASWYWCSGTIRPARLVLPSGTPEGPEREPAPAQHERLHDELPGRRWATTMQCRAVSVCQRAALQRSRFVARTMPRLSELGSPGRHLPLRA